MNSITFSKVNEMTIDEKYFAREPLLLQDGKLLCEICLYSGRDVIISLSIIDINILQVEQIITGLSNIQHLIQISDGRLFCCFCIDNMIFVANNRSLIIFKPK